MQATVIKAFKDKEDNKRLYEVNDVFPSAKREVKLTAKRFNFLVKEGWIKEVQEIEENA